MRTFRSLLKRSSVLWVWDPSIFHRVVAQETASSITFRDAFSYRSGLSLVRMHNWIVRQIRFVTSNVHNALACVLRL